MQRLRGWVFAGVVVSAGVATIGCGGNSGDNPLGFLDSGSSAPDSGEATHEDAGGDSGATTGSNDGGSSNTGNDASSNDGSAANTNDANTNTADDSGTGDGGAPDTGSTDASSDAAADAPVQAAPALLSISDGPTYAFGSKTDGAVSSHTFTVSNSGGSTATGLVASGVTAPFGFAGGSYPGTGGTCGATLAAGSNCSLALVFAPIAPGLASATLAIGYSDGTATQSATRAIDGTGVAPAALSFSDGATYGFGVIAAGGEADHLLVVTNTGAIAATGIAAQALASPFVYQGGAFPGTTGTCGSTLQPGESCYVAIAFEPTGSAGSTADLSIDYGDGTATVTATIALTGAGTSVASLRITDYQPAAYGAYGLPSDPAVFDFGSRGLSSATDRTFFVSNVGAGPASALAGGALAAPFSFKGGSFPGTGGGCGSTLAAGASCSVIVTFSPTTAVVSPAALSVSYSDGTTNHAATRSLTGTGTSAAVLSVYDYDAGNNMGISLSARFDYGSLGLGSTSDHTFFVTNGGGAAATAMTSGTMSAPFTYKGGSFPGTGGTCAASLPAVGACTVVVTFAPTVAGQASGNVAVSYNDGTTSQTATRPIVGAGTPQAVLVITDNNDPALVYGFGTLPTGSSTDATFTVANVGGTAATSVSASALASPFKFKGGVFPGTGGTCGTTLASNAACNVVITYAPTVGGTTTTALALSYYDGAATQSAKRTIVATATAQALLSVSGCSGNCGQSPDGSNAIGFGTTGQAVTMTFYVINGGAQGATSIAGAGLSAPFAFTGGAYPGTGGTCGSGLAAGATCTLSVTFTPTGNSTTSETLAITYYDGSANQSATQGVTGTSTTNASLTIVDSMYGGVESNPHSFGTAGTVQTSTLYVVNSGAQAATAMGDGGTLGSGFAYAGNAYPGTGGTCGTTLVAGSECSVVLTFTPSGNGVESSTLTVSYGNGSGTASATRALTATSTTQALLSIYFPGEGGGGGGSGPPPYNFGTVGIPSNAMFYVQNSGGGAATSMTDGGTLGSGFAYAGGAYPGSGGTCGATLAIGVTCTVVVTYTPSGNGVQSSTLTIDYQNGPSTTVTQALTATATNLPIVIIDDFPGENGSPGPSPYSYGTVGLPTDHTFTVQNAGGATATSLADGGTLGNGFGFKGTTYPGAGGTCGSTLAVGASCTVVVTYTPSGNSSQSSTLTLAYQGGSAPNATRSLTAVSTTQALISIGSMYTSNPGPYDYGTTGIPMDATFDVLNQGGGSATSLSDGGTLAPAFAYKGGHFPGTGGTCASTLASGAGCTLVVTYTPSGVKQQVSMLTIDYLGGSTPSVTQELQGTPTSSPLLTIDGFAPGNPPNPFFYGTWGVATEHTFNIVNIGGATAVALGDGGALGGAFSYAGVSGTYPGSGGNCGSSLASGASCTVVVEYAPSGTVPQSSTLTVVFNGGGTSRSLSGTPTSVALLSITPPSGGPGTPYNYGPSVLVPTDATFTVLNSGAVSATSVQDGATLGNGFAYKVTGYPGQGGTCTGTITAGSSCFVVVTYTPSGSVQQNSTLTLDYLGGGSTTSTTQALSGTP